MSGSLSAFLLQGVEHACLKLAMTGTELCCVAFALYLKMPFSLAEIIKACQEKLPNAATITPGHIRTAIRKNAAFQQGLKSGTLEQRLQARSLRFLQCFRVPFTHLQEPRALLVYYVATINEGDNEHGLTVERLVT